MRMKLFGLALIVGFAGIVEAQEGYTINGSAAQVADLRRHTLAVNRSTCARLQQAPNCNQATACTAAGAQGGSGCSNAQARAANARIWPDTLAGREEYVTFIWILPRFQDAKSALPLAVQGDYCTWWATQIQTVREAECSKIGAPVNGGIEACYLCP